MSKRRKFDHEGQAFDVASTQLDRVNGLLSMWRDTMMECGLKDSAVTVRPENVLTVLCMLTEMLGEAEAAVTHISDKRAKKEVSP